MQNDNSDSNKSPIKRTDGFVKSVLETEAAAREFLEEYLPAKVKDVLDLSKITTEKDTFVDDDLSRRLSDIIYAVQSKNGEKAYVVCIIEHQSTPEKLIALRLWKYSLLLFERYALKKEKFPIVAHIVLYNGEKKYTAPRSLWELFSDPSLAKEIMTGDYTLVDLQAMSDDDIKKKRHLGMFQYILKHIHMRNMLSLIKQFMNEYHDAILIDKTNGYIYFRKIISYIGERVEKQDRDALKQIIIDNLPDKDGEKIMTTVAESYRQEGVQAGIELGKEEGMQQGMQQGMILVAKNMLAKNKPISEIVEFTGLSIEEIKDLQK